MNIDRAIELLAELIQLSEQHDAAGIQEHNLPVGSQMALSRLLGISREIRALEGLLERKMAEETEQEQLVLNLLQQLP